MNIFEIIDYTRVEVLDDTLPKYKWDDLYLLRHLNRAYEELCRETKCLIDTTTPSTCRVNLLSNQGGHVLNAKVIYVYEMYRQSDGYPLTPKTEAFMGTIMHGWRNTTGAPFLRIMDTASRVFTIYPKYDLIGYIVGSSDINFVVATGPVYTITKAGATFTSHFSAGDSLVVTGTTKNNRTFTITNVAATTLTVSEATVAEAGTSAILQKVRDVAILRVARLPLSQWTLAQLQGSNPPTPEIDETYHMGLSDGIAKFAFKKQDTETYDPEMAKFHEDKFEEFKSQVAWDVAHLMEGGTIGTPHYGAL